MVQRSDIDVLETVLRKRGDLLDILLKDRTTGRNIIWGTDAYKITFNKDDPFGAKRQIKAELVTDLYGKLIQPRAAKSHIEQKRRTREKAEVFTPLKTVGSMNKMIDWEGGNWPATEDNWRDYVRELRLEITCGEAPFIVSRYNPTVNAGKIIELKNRVGFLDRKLRVVSGHCNQPKDWVFWAKEAYKASYGYEWQGDNILIARENLLYSLIDHYHDKFGVNPSINLQQEFAEIISWNVFQMDGIKYVVPMSCNHETRIIPGDLTLFGEMPDRVEKHECEGCKFNRPTKHNGRYVKVMDWSKKKPVKFVELTVAG